MTNACYDYCNQDLLKLITSVFRSLNLIPYDLIAEEHPALGFNHGELNFVNDKVKINNISDDNSHYIEYKGKGFILHDAPKEHMRDILYHEFLNIIDSRK